MSSRTQRRDHETLACNPPCLRRRPTIGQHHDASQLLDNMCTHSSARGELAPHADPSHATDNREVPQHILDAQVLNPESQRRHQAADDDERRGEYHAGLARPPVRDEPQKQDAKDLPDNQGVGDPRLVVGCVPIAEHVREDDVHRGGDVLLVTVGEVGCGLSDGVISVESIVCPLVVDGPRGLTQPATAKMDVVRQLVCPPSWACDLSPPSSGAATVSEICVFSLRSAAGVGPCCSNTAIWVCDDILCWW